MLRADYACDLCRSRKIACSRKRPSCEHCISAHESCSYSRSGVIRRKRRRHSSTTHSDDEHATRLIHSLSRKSDTIATSDETTSPTVTRGRDPLESSLAVDIATTDEQLRAVEGSDHNTSGTLSSLAEVCATVWHDSEGLERNVTSKSYHRFAENSWDWVELFDDTLRRGTPLLNPPPAQILQTLRNARPDLVHEKAWLLLYYSVVLSSVSSRSPHDEETKRKLQFNIWLTLHDARLLLEPSENNIQALIMLAQHVEEFTTPSLCWMLTGNACRMLQALGVNSRHLSSETRERRKMVFWHLNIVDQGLALIFGRPPNLHRALARDIDIPRLEQLRQFNPHASSGDAPSLFGAHFIHQMFHASRIIGDIWSLLYGEGRPSDSAILAMRHELEEWYQGASKVLEAAALAEKPFLDVKSVRTIDLGLTMLHFQHHYLSILLCRPSVSMRAESISLSRKLLLMLDKLVSDSEEPFNGIVWHLLCGPFTPFLLLFRDVLANVKTAPWDAAESLSAMEQLPLFLDRMSVRNSLAVKLKGIAEKITAHAQSLLQATKEIQTSRTFGVSAISHDPVFEEIGQPWDGFLTHTMEDAEPFWSSEYLGDIDWIGTDTGMRLSNILAQPMSEW